MSTAAPAEPVLQPIEGLCAEGFELIRQAFVENFTIRGDVGAALTVVAHGDMVVDLWGGWRDEARTQRWQRETVVNIWSTTKGVAAMCFAMLVDQGRANYEEPVATWWPEFAQAGKGAVTLGDLLSHRAGLCGFATPASVADLLAGSRSAARLAAQAPLWPLGEGFGYHAITGGILATELFERIEGRSLRKFVADELAGNRGLDIQIGLAAADEPRRAKMIAPADMTSVDVGSLSAPQIAALGNPPLDPLLPNSLDWRRADLPSANGHATARALAELYWRLISGELVSTETLRCATSVRSEGVDLVLGVPTRWAAGFLRNTGGVYGPNDAAFGHSGWGGSFAMADPATGVTIAYVMNRMGSMLRDDPRDVALIQAVFDALESLA